MERETSADNSLTAIHATWNDIIQKVQNGEIRIEQGFECKDCFNSGFRQVSDPHGGRFTGVVRCDQCRYWEFQRARIAA